MTSIILYTLLCVLVSLLIAGGLIRRSRTVLGLALGILPIAVMEAIFHLSLRSSIRTRVWRAPVCLPDSRRAA